MRTSTSHRRARSPGRTSSGALRRAPSRRPPSGARRDRTPTCVRAAPCELCGELAAHGVAETVQHDDLHLANVYERGGRFRLLDWGEPRSRTRSRRSSSRSASSRRSTGCHRPIPGSSGCAMPTWSRGAAASARRSRSPSGSAHSPTRSPGPDNETTSLRKPVDEFDEVLLHRASASAPARGQLKRARRRRAKRTPPVPRATPARISARPPNAVAPKRSPRKIAP